MTGLLNEKEFSRKSFLKGGGALVVGFSLAGARLAAKASATSNANYQPPLGDYGPNVSQLDSWLAVHADNTVTLYTGIVVLATGSLTGVLQIAAEELDVPFSAMRVVPADTSRTPDQFIASGSSAISRHSPPIRQAAAEARAFLVNLASSKLGVPVSQLSVVDGVVSGSGKSISYGDLLGGQLFNAQITGTVKPKDPSQYKIVGTSVPRIDLPAKAAGTYTYLHNIRLPGMLHGRLVRPASQGASLLKVDEGSIKHLPDVQVVRQSDWLGVVAPKEYDAIQAAVQLKVSWSEWSGLPAIGNLATAMRNAPLYDPAADVNMHSAPGQPARPRILVPQNIGNADAALASAAKKISATYMGPYHTHGVIGPAAAVAMWQGSQLTVWSLTQTPYGLREALAHFFGLPNNNVRLISSDGAGHFGMNTSDDATLDAAIMSKLAGKPVRLQYMRWDDHGWDNYDSARLYDMSGAVDANGRLAAWKIESWSFAGLRRPEYAEPLHGGEPGTLVAAQLAGWTGAASEQGASAGITSTAPYTVPNAFVKNNDLGPVTARQGAIRIPTSSMRTVPGFKNTFASESFIDELAALAGVDPIQFRLNHLTNLRQIAALQAAAARAGWQYRPSPNPNRGKNGLMTGRGVALFNNAAEIFEVSVDTKTGKISVPRVTVALDGGQHINPNAIEAQIEGAVTMGISRTIWEEITFNRSTITSRDWVTYPILRFKDAPGEIDIVLLPHQDQPSLGVGEMPHTNVAAGLANALFDATGVRIRQLPLRSRTEMKGPAR
jgi:nicotinate dehydrogenase subunit B